MNRITAEANGAGTNRRKMTLAVCADLCTFLKIACACVRACIGMCAIGNDPSCGGK